MPKIEISTEKIILYSNTSLYKTADFVKETRYFSGIDTFLEKLSEGVLSSYTALIDGLDEKSSSDDCFLAELVSDARKQLFLFKFGFQFLNANRLQFKDIVFIKYIDTQKKIQQNDRFFPIFLRIRKSFSVNISRAKCENTDESKLFRLYNADLANFPLLNKEQQEIVTEEEDNTFVQGVAGSGKTNICIDKIIYSACRGYYGKTLYSTFSRGLLIETKNKVETFRSNIERIISAKENGLLCFGDLNKKDALQNRLGVWLKDGNDLFEQLRDISNYLENKVDYYLIEDLYSAYCNQAHKLADENYFIKKYVGNEKNYHLSGNLEKVKGISLEVIYKEIYGLINGWYDVKEPSKMSLGKYLSLRQDSFGKTECEVIWRISEDYYKHLKNSSLTDNNLMSRALLEKSDDIPKYSLAVIDEVQDFTQVNLFLLKSLARKLFTVGDALQMINPSYFNISYLKNLMYKKDLTSNKELVHNYRNSKRIEQIVDGLGELNISKFGTHSFVLRSEGGSNDEESFAVYTQSGKLIPELSRKPFENYTVVVASNKKKEETRRLLKNVEVLTVSEIKGLEREVVLLYDVLSDNEDKWSTITRRLINRKTADENSVYRYYFNLLYVGISRAKRHVFVAESKEIPFFSEFFEKYFDKKNTLDTLNTLSEVVGKIEIDALETKERIGQFLNLGQYDNARFAVGALKDEKERDLQLKRIDVIENYVSEGKYREAGIRFWELGLLDDAKKQFNISGNQKLAELIDACTENNDSRLSYDIIQFYLDVGDNEIARKLIVETLERDLSLLKQDCAALTVKKKK